MPAVEHCSRACLPTGCAAKRAVPPPARLVHLCRCGYTPPTILTSSKSGQGRSELLAHVAQLREFFTKQNHSTLA